MTLRNHSTISSSESSLDSSLESLINTSRRAFYISHRSGKSVEDAQKFELLQDLRPEINESKELYDYIDQRPLLVDTFLSNMATLDALIGRFKGKQGGFSSVVKKPIE